MEQKRARFVVISGVLTLVVFVAMGAQFLSLQKQIIAFELVQSTSEVHALLAEADAAALDRAACWDFAFMLAYSAFNSAMVWFLGGPALVAWAIGGMMLVGDFVENVTMLQMTAGDITDATVARLGVSTVLKWCTLFGTMFLLGGLYARRRHKGWMIYAPLAIVAGLAGVVMPRMMASKAGTVFAPFWIVVLILAIARVTSRAARSPVS